MSSLTRSAVTARDSRPASRESTCWPATSSCVVLEYRSAASLTIQPVGSGAFGSTISIVDGPVDLIGRLTAVENALIKLSTVSQVGVGGGPVPGSVPEGGTVAPGMNGSGTVSGPVGVVGGAPVT